MKANPKESLDNIIKIMTTTESSERSLEPYETANKSADYFPIAIKHNKDISITDQAYESQMKNRR